MCDYSLMHVKSRPASGPSASMPARVFPEKTERLIVALALLPIAMPKLAFSTRTLSKTASILCPATAAPAALIG